MTFKCLLYDFAGGDTLLNGPFDEEEYLQASTKLWNWLRELQPHFWRHGETFPENVAQLHQLFSNNEVDFTMSNNDGEVDNKVVQGVLPELQKRTYLIPEPFVTPTIWAFRSTLQTRRLPWPLPTS